MYVLELCIREIEGTWSNLICISRDKQKLEERAIIEQVKYLQENGEEYFKDFQVGFLENIIRKKIKEIRETYSEDENIYNYNGMKINLYQGVRDYVFEYGLPFAKNLNLDEKIVTSIIKDGFYVSKQYVIREVEEI